MPASRIASVHGGVRPWWQQGSSETYSVAPCEIVVAGGADRLDLGVRRPERAVKALGDHGLAVGHHRADERIRADPAAALLGQLDRSGEVAPIGVGSAACAHAPTLAEIARLPHFPPVSR